MSYDELNDEEREAYARRWASRRKAYRTMLIEKTIPYIFATLLLIAMLFCLSGCGTIHHTAEKKYNIWYKTGDRRHISDLDIRSQAVLMEIRRYNNASEE